MSGYNVHYSAEALQDLDNIADYMILEFDGTEVAARTISHITSSIDILMDFPKMGAPLSSITDIESNYRFIVVEHYMVFYRVEDVDVYIDRILHGKRDYFRVLFEPGQSE